MADRTTVAPLLRGLPIVVCALLPFAGIVGCDAGATFPDRRTNPPPMADGGPIGFGGCDDTTDSDGDGIADAREGTVDSDGDGTPNHLDSDSDGDGISDLEEAAGGGGPCAPADSDLDGIADFADSDSDNDGLTDREEVAAASDPRVADTDGDGVDDLTETVAGSDPVDPTSGPPDGSLYVVLPYYAPGEPPGTPERREFEFQTQVKAADVFFVVDTTGSMRDTVSSVQSNLSSTIIPGVDAAIGADGDVRYGLAAHGDFAEGGSNYTGNLTIYANLSSSASAAASATSYLRADNGGDAPESQIPAMHALIQGAGYGVYDSGGSSYATRTAAHPDAPKTPTRMVDPRLDCPGVGPDDAVPYGWGCFVEGRLPVIVLMSDATMHNGPGMGNRYSAVQRDCGGDDCPIYNALVNVMNEREAIFVGVSVGYQAGTSQYRQLANATNSLDGGGSPLVFSGNQTQTANLVRDALVEIIGQSRQDITTRVDPDEEEARIAAGHSTADFITAVRPLRGIPEAPSGYDSLDETTFRGVAPSTRVVFEAELYNDFQPGGDTAQVFRANIVVLGRAGTEVDERQVYIVVPASGAQIII